MGRGQARRWFAPRGIVRAEQTLVVTGHIARPDWPHRDRWAGFYSISRDLFSFRACLDRDIMNASFRIYKEDKPASLAAI